MLDDAEPTVLGAAAAISTPTMPNGEPTLVSENGDRTSLPEGELTVGREDGLGISLAGESTVSRRHATVSRSGKTAVVKDLGSTNGTFVNGTRLQGEATLKPGDQVQFGSVRFRYEG
jgi:pSer/pThr/pTyr-binding forkhead associated (FHA) protein